MSVPRVAPSAGAPRSAASIQGTFARARQRFVAAYRAALDSSRSLRGRLVVEVTIRRDGSVAVARFVTATIHEAALQTAVLHIVRSLSFGPGAAQTVAFPIDLAPARGT